MTLFKSPIVNAVLASLYIIAVVCVMQYVTHAVSEEGIIIPIMILSLLVLSVTMMAAFFFLQPIQLYLNNKKKDALAFFLQTVSAFSVLTLAVLLVLLSGIAK